MSSKVKEEDAAIAIKKVERKVVNFKQGSGTMRNWTVPKAGGLYVLTRRQIARIPKGRFRVKVIGVATDSRKVGNVREGDVAYFIQLVEKVHETANKIREDSRKESRMNSGGGGGTPPVSGIFNRLVDEDQLADCILRIINDYFHGGDECEICKKRFNLFSFCLMMHFYFDYIHILENTSQLPYCTYLKNKVFGGIDRVNTRTFHNYSKNVAYSNFKDLLVNNKSIRFESRPVLPRQKAENILLAPFQEIGWKFQHSPYFDELRRQRATVISFIIQENRK